MLGVGRRLKKEGSYIHTSLIHVVQQKLIQHCKAIILQFNKFKKRKEKKNHQHCPYSLVRDIIFWLLKERFNGK